MASQRCYSGLIRYYVGMCDCYHYVHLAPPTEQKPAQVIKPLINKLVPLLVKEKVARKFEKRLVPVSQAAAESWDEYYRKVDIRKGRARETQRGHHLDLVNGFARPHQAYLDYSPPYKEEPKRRITDLPDEI